MICCTGAIAFVYVYSSIVSWFGVIQLLQMECLVPTSEYGSSAIVSPQLSHFLCVIAYVDRSQHPAVRVHCRSQLSRYTTCVLNERQPHLGHLYCAADAPVGSRASIRIVKSKHMDTRLFMVINPPYANIVFGKDTWIAAMDGQRGTSRYYRNRRETPRCHTCAWAGYARSIFLQKREEGRLTG